MKTTSELIDISMHILSYLSDLKFDSSVQAIVKQSQYKDQFLKVSIKRMQETQFFKDELKESTELNSFLYAQNQELEAKLAQESQLKDGKFLLPLHLENQVISEYTLD
jgi:cell shape-determining protein MreC